MSKPATSGCHDSFETSGTLGVDAPNGFHLEFKVLLGASLPKKLIVAPGVTLFGPTDKCEYYVDVGLTNSVLYEEHTTAPTTSLLGVTSAKLGQWNTVSIDVAGAGTNRVVSLRINGTTAIDKAPLDPACQAASTIDHMSVGIFCVERSLDAGVDVNFDDVLLTVPQ